MGCILAELWTGSLLFSTHSDLEHLALMERSLGALPRHLLRAATCKRADRNFRHGYLRWPERAIDRESEEHVRAQRRLREVVGCDSRGEQFKWSPELADFHDLLLKLLEYVPDQRITAHAACQHPFVLRGTHAKRHAASAAPASAASAPAAAPCAAPCAAVSASGSAAVASAAGEGASAAATAASVVPTGGVPQLAADPPSAEPPGEPGLGGLGGPGGPGGYGASGARAAGGQPQPPPHPPPHP